jgi:long-subunit fatty acid transport protein
MRRSLWLGVAIAAALGIAPPLRAQVSGADLTLPPGTAIPNYDRIRIGQNEGLEGNAYVARTGDAGSSWYNPAGLAMSDRTVINAGGNAYELTSFSVEGLGESKGTTRLAPIGTYFGGVLGSPTIHSKKLRVGFSIARPISWTPSRVQGAFTASSPGGDESFLYSSFVSLTTDVPAINAGYRLSDRFRIGAGVGVAITSLYQNQTVSDRLINGASASGVLRTLETEGQDLSFLVSGGLQYEIGSSIRLGALVTAPGARISGSSRITFQSTSYAGPATRDVAFNDDEAAFEYANPLRASGGLALRLGKGEIEADVLYRGSRDPYELYSSDVAGTSVRIDSTGAATTGSIAFAPAVEESRAVTNIAVGGNYPLSEKVRAHVGFFTDQSPVANASTSIFRKVDMVGGSLGISLKLGALSGSFGVSGSSGTSEARSVGTTLGNLPTITEVKVRTFNALYALSYAF